MPTARKSPSAARVAKAVMRLALSEQHRLFFALKDHLFPDKKPDIHGRIKDIREARNTLNLCCPHCQGNRVVRFGKYRDRQRYRCKAPECGKTLNDTTLSPLAGTRYSEKWLQYIQYMVSGKPLRYIAKKLDIHLSTAFYWRLKVLRAIRAMGFESLAGIVESDETYFLESHKGLVAQDRQGHVLSQVAGMGENRLLRYRSHPWQPRQRNDYPLHEC